MSARQASGFRLQQALAAFGGAAAALRCAAEGVAAQTAGIAVYDAIAEERERQLAKGRDAAHDDARSRGDWMTCLDLVIATAPSIVAERDTWRAFWIKVAAVAVAAVEAIDREAARQAGGGR